MTSDSDTDLSGMSMAELFRLEVETQAATLTEGLLQIEHGAEDRRFEELMRAAHSIKGAARMVNVPPVVAIAHAMEDCFVAAQDGELLLGSAHVDHFLHCIDVIQRIAVVNEADLSAWLGSHQSTVDEAVANCQALRQPHGENSLDLAMAELAPAQPETDETTQGRGNPVERGWAPETDSAGEVKPAASSSGQAAELFIRVSAPCFDQLMGVAAESLVESRRLIVLTRSLARLQAQQRRLLVGLDRVREALVEEDAAPELLALLCEVQHQAAGCCSSLSDKVREFEQFDRRSMTIAENLHGIVVSSRMRPFADGVAGLQRKLRDIARDLGKQVNFIIDGLSTPVDREVLERIKSPLDHLLRNALDHGIEFPDERQRSGKSREGTIRVSACHSAGMLSITIADDGCGVDLALLRERIVSKGLCSLVMVSAMSDAELLEFLFLPGFSTRQQVTELSGRGVGMDAVMTKVKQLQGSIRAHNEPEKGFQLEIRLPLSLSVIRALLVEIAGEAYAFPLARVSRIEKIRTNAVETLAGNPYMVIEERNISLVDSRQILGIEPVEQERDELAVVIIGESRSVYGIVVDRFLGEREVVVQALSATFGRIKYISSAATLDDGSIGLIFDVEDILHGIHHLHGGNALLPGKAASKSPVPRILVVDDSPTVRETERKLLQRYGYQVEVAADGADAWDLLRRGDYALVITDVDMPRMNGIELVEHIREDTRYATLPVVIVSYKDRAEDRQRGLAVGADYYLTKGSFQDDTLRTAVADLIGEVAA